MPRLILQAKAPLEPRDDRTLVAIRQIKNLRYFQVGVSVEDICGIQVIRGQILFEFRISFDFRGFEFRVSLVLGCSELGAYICALHRSTALYFQEYIAWLESPNLSRSR